MVGLLDRCLVNDSIFEATFLVFIFVFCKPTQRLSESKSKDIAIWHCKLFGWKPLWGYDEIRASHQTWKSMTDAWLHETVDQVPLFSKIIFSIVSSSSFPTLCCGFFVFGTPAPPVPPPMVNWWFRLVVYSCRNPVCKRILLGKWKENYSSLANRKDQLKPMNHFCSSNNRVVYSCPLMTP